MLSIKILLHSRVACDADGWMLRVNDEPEYNSFMHLFDPKLVKSVKFLGHAQVNFIGFGPADMTAAPEVGFNLTYVCPEDQVFDHDWFATPFVMMTCQVTT